MADSDRRRPAESASFGALNVQTYPVDTNDQRHSLYVVQGAVSGPALAAYLESANTDRPVTHVHSPAATSSRAIARWTYGSAGTVALEVRADSTIVLGGETISAFGAWSDLTLGTNVTAGTGSTPGSRLERGRVMLRGRPAWAAQTFAAATVLFTIAQAHWPVSPKSFSIRTSPDSNISSVLDLNPANGQVTNRTSFGAGTTAYLPLDGLSYDLS